MSTLKKSNLRTRHKRKKSDFILLAAEYENEKKQFNG